MTSGAAAGREIMDRDSAPQQAPGVLAEEVDGELLLYRLGDHKAVHLNDTASLIWQLCDGSRDLEAMLSELRALFPDAGEEPLSFLLAEGAIVAADGAGPARDDAV